MRNNSPHAFAKSGGQLITKMDRQNKRCTQGNISKNTNPKSWFLLTSYLHTKFEMDTLEILFKQKKYNKERKLPNKHA